MQIIQNNPYRIVGLLVGATAAEQRRQLTRLQRFIEAEQEPDEDYSLPILGSLYRTIDDVSDATSKLNLDGDKMNAALFWFYEGNSITDEPAFDLLKEGRIKEAVGIWAKLTNNNEVTNKNASAFHNLSTLLLNAAIKNDTVDEGILRKGLRLKLQFLESDFIEELKALATDRTYKTTKKNLQLLLLYQVQAEIDKKGGITSVKFIEILNKLDFSAKGDFLKDFVQKPIDQIERNVEETKKKRKENPRDAEGYGSDLYEETENDLEILRAILDYDSVKYQSVCDKVANELLQCGIDFFKEFRNDDFDPSSESMDLFVKAESIACGGIIIQRIQENTENLQEWIDDSSNRELNKKIGEDVEYIIERLNLAAETLKNKGKYPLGYDDPYSEQPLEEQPHNKGLISSHSILNTQPGHRFDALVNNPPDYIFPFKENEFNINLFRLARDTVKKCKPKLDKIKNVVGSSDELYQKLSNDVASISLACLIDYVNNTGNLAFRIPPKVDENEINIMNSIGELDMDFEMCKRYNEQKESLENLYKAVQRRSSSSFSSSTSTGRTSSPSTPSSRKLIWFQRNSWWLLILPGFIIGGIQNNDSLGFTLMGIGLIIGLIIKYSNK